MSKPALLLVGHGSRAPAGVADYWRLAEVVGAVAPDLRVGCGFIELAAPGLDEAIDAVVAGGADSVVGVPLVLLGAGHLKSDGPAALARARHRHPGVSFSYARDLGIHPSVLSVASDRISEALAAAAVPGDAAVVVVGRGSTDPDANSDLHTHSDADVHPDSDVHADPDVHSDPDEYAGRRCHCDADGDRGRDGRRRPDTVGRLLAAPELREVGGAGIIRRDVVLVERIRDQTEAWAAAHPDVTVVVGPYLGPDPRIASLVLERYAEAIAGEARMNCDCCVYRTPLPGYEHRVGQPLPTASHAHAHHR